MIPGPASWLNRAAEWFLGQTAEAITTVLEVALNASGPLVGGRLFGGALTEPVSYAAGVGLWVLPIFVLLGVVTWTVRAQPGRIVQLLVVETPLAAVGMLLVPMVVTELAGIADAIFGAVVDVAPVEQGLRTVVQGQLVGGPVATLLVLAGAVLMLVGGLVTYLVLLVRSVVIGVSVLLGPVLLATRTWEPARGVAGKWVALTVMVVMVKPVIGFVWMVGWSLLGGPAQAAAGVSGATQATSQVMTGAAVLLLGGLVPTALFKLVPEMGDRVSRTLHTGTGSLAMRGMAVGGAAVSLTGGAAAGAAGAGVGPATAGSVDGRPAAAAGGCSGGGADASPPGIPVGAYGAPDQPGSRPDRPPSPPPPPQPADGSWPLRRTTQQASDGSQQEGR